MSSSRRRNVPTGDDLDENGHDYDNEDLPVVDIDVYKKEHIIKLRAIRASTSLVAYWYCWVLPFLLLTVFAYDICKLVHPAIRAVITCQKTSGWATDYGIFNSTVKCACLAGEVVNAILLAIVWVVSIATPPMIAIILAQLVYLSKMDIILDRQRYLLRARRRQEEALDAEKRRRERVKRLREKLMQRQHDEEYDNDEEEAIRPKKRRVPKPDNADPAVARGQVADAPPVQT